ncbi:MAG: hypothetical protein ED556_03300 [Winogradskyella sp.]|uniref:outer membrane beta-barrel protein n=1 Tax=Winogradskyella sp. TaxID=1883156 RepID=UPI000F3EEF8F|nr:outer membrane beta-barrel protein [Winogradskyella sp.]RNC88223.1 MAG: hypothetical protein ED556_03300 [Winogradskyella sp.]
MSDKKHIDRLFQEKFKDFDVMPNDNVWENIEARIQKKKKKRRVIPIWWQLGGVAAALILLFAIINPTIGNNNNDTPIVVDTEHDSNSEKSSSTKDDPNTVDINKENTDLVIDNSSDANDSSSEPKTNAVGGTTQPFSSPNNNRDRAVVSENISQKPNTTNSNALNNLPKSVDDTYSNAVVKSNENDRDKSQEQLIKSKSELDKLIKSSSEVNTVVKNTSDTDNTDDATTEEVNKEEENKQTIEEAIAEAKELSEKEKKLRRWSVAPNVAPVYFSSLGEGSSIDPQFNNNNTNSDISMSYGIKGSYAINKRLKIKAGINRVNFNNITENVIALADNSFSSTASSAGRLENVRLNNEIDHSSVTLLSQPNINSNSASVAVKTIATGNLEQRFGFIEVPLEVEYRLVDKKLGVNVSGGFSTLFLNENEIFADINGQSTSIGEANNLNDTSFSANFGVGVDYSLTDKININLEPKFKYQLNTFNNTSGDFRPFFIGVYTGLSFKF